MRDLNLIYKIHGNERYLEKLTAKLNLNIIGNVECGPEIKGVKTSEYFCPRKSDYHKGFF